MGRSTATDIMSEDRITTSINTHPPLVEAARALGPAIWARRDEIEEGRRLPPPLVQVMAEAGLFRMLMPAQFGGGEVDPATALGVIEEVSQADGSAGWCLMIGATGGMLAAFLPEHGAREVFGRDPNVIAGGAVRQTGRAVAVDGGYRVTGRWAYGSGCQHSDWLIGGCVIDDGDAPRQGEHVMPKAILPMLPAAECEIIDTWSVGGLRGTGSHDFAVSDLFVPEERVIPLPFPSPSQLGPLYAFPFFGLWGCCVASVATGIARGAIDALTELAAVKTPLASAGLLRERSTIQVQVAQAEATLRSARALMFDTVVEVWEAVVAGEPVSLDQRALLRLAAVHATTSAAQAVDLMYHAGGATANYTRSPLERAFRDVHAVTQHILVAPLTYEMTGRVLLGMEPGMPYI